MNKEKQAFNYFKAVKQEAYENYLKERCKKIEGGLILAIVYLIVLLVGLFFLAQRNDKIRDEIYQGCVRLESGAVVCDIE